MNASACGMRSASGRSRLQGVDSRIFGNKRCLPLVEPDEAVASSDEDVRCEQRDVLERPSSQRRDPALRHAWRAVLTGDEAIAKQHGTVLGRATGQTAARRSAGVAVGMEVEDDRQTGRAGAGKDGWPLNGRAQAGPSDAS